MDPLVLVIVLAVGMPVAVVLGLAKAAQLRGPAPRRESRRRVDLLVTQAVPQENADESDLDDDSPGFSIDSAPPEHDPGLRDR